MGTYKKNYLTSVAVRIDFGDIDTAKVKSYLSLIKDTFQKTEEKKGFESQFTFQINEGVSSTAQQNSPLTIWDLKNNDESKIGQITSKWLWIEYKKYQDSTVLIADVKNIFDNFINHFNLETINRIGLRYSNVIKLENHTKPTDWDDFINPKLLASISFAKDNSFAISRSMGQIIVHSDRNDLRFDFGIWNSDYPNKVARKEFVLEYDCYTNLAMETSGVKLSELIADFNKQCENLFEKSITDKLRNIMNK